MKTLIRVGEIFSEALRSIERQCRGWWLAASTGWSVCECYTGLSHEVLQTLLQCSGINKAADALMVANGKQ